MILYFRNCFHCTFYNCFWSIVSTHSVYCNLHLLTLLFTRPIHMENAIKYKFIFHVAVYMNDGFSFLGVCSTSALAITCSFSFTCLVNCISALLVNANSSLITATANELACANK